MICGETLLKICKDPKMPARPTVAMWLVDQREAYKEFHQAYARAREGLGDHMFEEAAEIADDGKADYKLTGRNGDVIAVDNEVVQRSRLRVDVRLKMAAHLNPARYGENKRMNDSDPDTTVKFLIEGGLPSA